MVKPLRVTVKNDAAIAAPEVTIVILVAVVGPHEIDISGMVEAPQATVGVMAGAKKPGGYMSATALPGGIGTEGLKPSVMDTADLPATRSMGAMANERDETALRMPPDAIASARSELTVAGCDRSL
jgi:hypothetical protein